MNLFVPYDDSELSRVALREACRIITPLDRVTVLSAVIVPASRDVAVLPGEIWKETCRAEVHLTHARQYAERFAHFGDGLRCVRVQARTLAGAILAGAAHYEADTILLAERAGMRGRLGSLFGPTAAILRRAPCDVRVVYTVAPPNARHRSTRRSVAALPLITTTHAAPVFLDMARHGQPEYPVQHLEGTSPYVHE